MQIMETQYIAVGGIRNDNDLKNFKQKVITGVDTAKVPEGSNSASYYYFFYNAMLRFVESDWEGCRKWLKQLIDLSNKVPYELKNNDGAQINVLYYYCLLCTLSGKWEEYYNYIEQLEGVKPKSLKDVIMKFEYLYYLKFSEGRDKLNWNNFEDTYAQFEASYEQYRNSLEAQSHIGLLTQCVNYLINRKRYIEAEKWINIILINNEFKKVRIDYHLVARICDIITVFERGKSELLMYRIATTKKYLVNKDKTYKVEGKFVKYLPKIMKSKTVDDKLRLINNLRNELDALFEDERQRRVLISFDYKAYINSLLEQVHQN